MIRFDRWLRNALRREARDMLRSRPATVELLRSVGPEIPSDERVLEVLDLCLQVGEVLLSSGEAAADTSATMARLAGSCGLATVDIDITFTSITICCHRGKSATPVTSMRILRYRTTDLTRLVIVTDLINQVVRGELDVRAAGVELDAAVSAPHPYRRWVATAGWAGLAAAVALLLGGPPVIWLIALLVTAFIDRAGRLLGRWGVPPFFLQMAGGFVATVSTLGLYAFGALPGTEPSLVIAASITVLLSGLSVMGAVQDAIAGHVVTAAGRAAEIALLSAGLLSGVILGLKVGIAFGLTLDPAEPVAADVARFTISTFAAAAAAMMFALACYAPLRSLIAAALAGGVGWAAFGALTLLLPFGVVVATGLAAVFIGLASELFRRGTRIDRHVIILSGIVPLLPGFVAYRGFYQLASTDEVVNGLGTITLALAIGLALAAGVTLGQLIARPRPAPEIPEPDAKRAAATPPVVNE